MATVSLTWKDFNLNEDGFNIYRSETPMDVNNMPAPIATIGPNVGSYDDTTGIVGTVYYYRVGAVRGTEEKISPEILKVFADTINMHDVFGDGSAVATYKFDGDATDLGGTYNGILGSTSSFDVGVNNQAVVTDGAVDGAVEIYASNTADMSVSFWISTTSVFNYGTYSCPTFFINENGQVEVFANLSGTGTANVYSFTADYPTDGTFFHIAISITNKVPTVYINGVEKTTSFVGVASRSANISSKGWLGRIDTSYCYAAKYDQLRMFNRALIQDEVLNLYQEGA